MNVVLLTPTPPDINAFGLRTISSVLKKDGHRVKSVFLPGGIQQLKFDASFVYKYPDSTLRQIADICADAQLIGFSLMSQYFDRAAQVSDYLKRELKVPIVWGGIHPTYRPEECLKHADGVCIGEGEYAILELAAKIGAGLDFRDVKGFWFAEGDSVRKNPPGPIVEDLDELPFIDLEMEDHYVFNWHTGNIIPIDEREMKEQTLRTPYFGDRNLYTYRTMTSRGCPHRCSYCASSAMERLRRRSIDNVIEELKVVLKRFDYIKLISFFDDTFFAAPTSYFEEFCEKYKREIGLPFHAQCSPTTVTKEKMDLLVDAGLYHTEMGVQTGSERIRAMYRRSESNRKIVEAAGLIAQYSSRMMPPYYHIILDNPWETVEDVKDTMKLVLELPGKYKFSVASLILFPGTELNEKARAEGILKDELNEVCRKPFTYPKATYLNWLILLAGYSAIPRVVLRFLAADVFVGRFHRQEEGPVMGFLFWATHKVKILGKGIRALLRGDFERIVNYFRLAR